jgi:L-amino acid N-acyltransferase YncA
VIVRDAVEADLPAILAIYNEIIATSTAVYRETPATLDERLAWWRAKLEPGYPTLVADDNGAVLGFATFGDFRSWPGYRFTVEHTVHVGRDYRGRGVGTALMGPLIARAESLGKHVMIAGVDADNAGSIAFHERLGFERVAHFREVGFKFNRWLDLVFLQRMLGTRSSAKC